MQCGNLMECWGQEGHTRWVTDGETVNLQSWKQNIQTHVEMYGASMMCLYYNYMAWNNYTQKTDKLEVGALEFQQPPTELVCLPEVVMVGLRA